LLMFHLNSHLAATHDNRSLLKIKIILGIDQLILTV